MSVFQKFRTQLGYRTQLFITGGEWVLALPVEARRNLRRFWFDGLFAAASDTVPINYITLYFLAVGATGSQIGWFSALTSLAAALCLLPGALLVERFGHAKNITVWFGGLGARVLLLVLALLPFGFSGQSLIWLLIGVGVVRTIVGNLAFPAWMSLTGSLVPSEGRGRYFGSRNLIMGLAAMILTFLMGDFITRMGAPYGYQIALMLSFGLGMISTYFFARIQEPPVETPSPTSMTISLKGLWQDLRSTPLFLAMCAAAALWNFALNIAGPFFNVYMVENLHFTAVMIGVTSVATSITRLVTQPKVGELADRWGAGRVQMLAMFMIPILPFTWIFITQLWQVIAINMLGGIIWGAFELSSFNFLLNAMPEAQRARYSALYQIVVSAALAGGAALGSAIIEHWGYQLIFFTSFAGRLFAAFVFMLLLRKVLHGAQTIKQELP